MVWLKCVSVVCVWIMKFLFVEVSVIECLLCMNSWYCNCCFSCWICMFSVGGVMFSSLVVWVKCSLLVMVRK